jgi:hypothetical protein
MVVQAEIGRITALGQSKQKSMGDPHLKQWLGVVACACYLQLCRKIQIQGLKSLWARA